MSVLQCPHCKSVHVITGDSNSDKCTNAACGGVMAELDEPEAGAAVRGAFYGHDHGLSPALSPDETARLAAAAPELLAALRLIVKRHHHFFTEDTFRRAQDAIVKATGRPSEAGKAAP